MRYDRCRYLYHINARERRKGRAGYPGRRPATCDPRPEALHETVCELKGGIRPGDSGPRLQIVEASGRAYWVTEGAP